MNIKDLLSVSGLPGLYKMIANRSNGLMVSNIETGKNKFASVRKHQFTPLETISIYTMEDTVELKEVLKKAMELDADTGIPSEKVSNDEVEELFMQVVHNFDPDRVHLKDMHKFFKWYNVLKKTGYLEAVDEEE